MGWQARIRTWNKGFKGPCDTISPPANRAPARHSMLPVRQNSCQEIVASRVAQVLRDNHPADSNSLTVKEFGTKVTLPACRATRTLLRTI